MKQQVKYKNDDTALIVVDGCAYVYAIDHPNVGSGYVRTSTVLSHDHTTGVFETKNSTYIPE